MNVVLFDKRRSLSVQVAEVLKGMDLLPGERLEIRRTHSHNTHIFRSLLRHSEDTYEGQVPPRNREGLIAIECQKLSTKALDKLLASPIEELELYHSSRYRVLHNHGIHFIGQLTRLWPYKELGHVKGIGKNTNIVKRLQEALREKGLAFGLVFSCGPREMKKLQKISIRFLVQTAWDAYREHVTKKYIVNKKFFTELEAVGITTMYDLVHAKVQVVERCYLRAYFQKFRTQGYSPLEIRRKVKDSELLKRLNLYLYRYQLSIGSEYQKTA
jgi:hypothetical protein